MTLPEDGPLKRIRNRIAPGWWTGIDIGPGWNEIVLDLDAKLATLFPDYQVHQVKEKFGGLRYYTEPVPAELFDRWHALIVRAERLCSETCEECGQPGTLRPTRWVRTLCDDHAAKHFAEEAKKKAKYDAIFGKKDEEVD